MEIPQRGGLPHSDIHGSTPARGSPWLFAACHVFHRLLVPRHPPNALIALEINLFQITPEKNPPCAGTIHPQKVGEKILQAHGWHFIHSAHRYSSPLKRSRHPLLEHPLSRMVGQTSQLAHRAITTRSARFLPHGQCLRIRRAEPETARPETYQNLIHNLKNSCSQSKARKHSRNGPPDITQARPFRNLFSSRECRRQRSSGLATRALPRGSACWRRQRLAPFMRNQAAAHWWRRAGSNR
jgi:hypothetical protein